MLTLRSDKFNVEHRPGAPTEVGLARYMTKDELRELALAASKAADELEARQSPITVVGSQVPANVTLAQHNIDYVNNPGIQAGAASTLPPGVTFVVRDPGKGGLMGGFTERELTMLSYLMAWLVKSPASAGRLVSVATGTQDDSTLLPLLKELQELITTTAIERNFASDRVTLRAAALTWLGNPHARKHVIGRLLLTALDAGEVG